MVGFSTPTNGELENVNTASTGLLEQLLGEIRLKGGTRFCGKELLGDLKHELYLKITATT